MHQRPGASAPGLCVTRVFAVISTYLSPLLRRPLVCLTLCWLIGILLASRLPIPWPSWIAAGLLLIAAWGIATAREGWVAAAALGLAVVCLGAARCAWQSPVPAPGSPRALPTGGVTLIGYPLTPPVQTASRWRTTFRLTARLRGAHRLPAAGDLYLTGSGEAPAPGHRYRVFGRVLPDDEPGNPYGFSWRAYLQEHNLTYAVRASLLAVEPGAAPVPRWHAARTCLAERLAASMPDRYAQVYAELLNGLLLGLHGAAMPPQLTEQFRRAGTIHLMVVSGSQVALLATFLLFPLWLAPRGRSPGSYPLPRMLLLLLALPVLGLYIVLADRGPSVDRALLMVLLTTGSVFLGFSPLARIRSYRPDGLTLLAGAALVISLANPWLVFNPGTQLSFAAVLGLLLVTPVLWRLLHRLLGPVALLPAATLGAQVMTAPILAWHFAAIPVLGPFTNLIAIPIVGLLVPLGMVTVLTALVLPAAAVPLNQINIVLLHTLVATGAAAARQPWAEWRWVIHSPGIVIGYFAILAAGLSLLSHWSHSGEKEWTIFAGREPRMW